MKKLTVLFLAVLTVMPLFAATSARGDKTPELAEMSEPAQVSRSAQNDIVKTEQLPEVAVRYALTDEEREAIERMVASEGGYCEYTYQALVATCILNGCEADGLRPTELFARGDYWLTRNLTPTETTKQAVSDVFDLGVMPTDEKIRYYYNPSLCTSPLHESKCYVLTNCGCRFFKDWE